MKKDTLDKNEQNLLQDFDSGKLESVADANQKKAKYQQYAKHTQSKSKNINIRLPERDLKNLKAIAAEKGLPYQTLISSLLHQYSSKRGSESGL